MGRLRPRAPRAAPLSALRPLTRFPDRFPEMIPRAPSMPVEALQVWPEGFLLKVRTRGPDRPVSRVLSRARVAPSAMKVIPLGRPLLGGSSALTRTPRPRLRAGDRADRSRRHPYSSLLREGLASPPVTRLSRVGSYPTISPLPVRAALASGEPSAVSFLWRFPSGHPGSVLPTSLSCGARTFLP